MDNKCKEFEDNCNDPKNSKSTKEEEINDLIKRSGCNDELISDGYHTFGDLYNFRKLYNAALFNEWAKQGKYEVHKSSRHYEGDLCFGGDWFIVTAVLPTGQISNHYHRKDWGLFNIPEFEKAQRPFDGHTPEDVMLRLERICKK